MVGLQSSNAQRMSRSMQSFASKNIFVWHEPISNTMLMSFSSVHLISTKTMQRGKTWLAGQDKGGKQARVSQILTVPRRP